MTNRLEEIREALLAALPEGGNALHHEEVNRLAELRLTAELLRRKLINGRRDCSWPPVPTWDIVLSRCIRGAGSETEGVLKLQ